MFCTTCGKKLSDNAMFCGYCGTSVNMKRREDMSVEQPQVPQPESQPEPQPLQPQDSQPLMPPVQMQVPPPITLPTPPQVSQPEPQPTQSQTFQPELQSPQSQAFQPTPQPTQSQAFQPTPQPTQPQASQPIPQPMQPQAPQPVQYMARPAGAPVPGVTEAPKKKKGWIVAVVLVAVVVVIGLSYLAYLAMVAYLRDAMDAAYREQYHEWHSYDSDTEWPWNVPGFSQDEPENSDETHNSEELFPSEDDNNQDGNTGEEDNEPDQPDWNEGNGSNGNYNRGDDVYAYDGAGIGYVGDIMHTYWFDFTVNDIMFCQTFQGYTAREGYQLIVLDMTIKNTFEEEVPMFDTDFWVEWGEDDYDFDYSNPVSDLYDISTDFLPERYYLTTDDIVTGLLMYEVPVGYSEYMLIFEEYYEDGDVGDWFGVYLYSDAGPNIHTL